MLVWPVNLAVFYPHPGWRSAWEVLPATAALLGISWWCWRHRQAAPAALAGWLWFLVSLAPMIGVIQVGDQARADRYLYLAMLGPLIALAGASVAGAPGIPWQPRRGDVATDRLWTWATVAVVAVCLPLTWRQAGVWRDSHSLFSHALAAGHDSAVARNNLGLALTELGKPAAALTHLQRAVERRADDADAWFNLGNAQTSVGELASASAALKRCLALDPDRFKAWNNLGIVLVLQGDPAAAEAAWRQSLAIRPDFPDARLNLEKLLGRSDEAVPGLGNEPEQPTP
jgi:tetratricopeptide (TPR) repeat protein